MNALSAKGRVNQCLRMMMSFHIARYLMSNTKGREDGAEKAQQHIMLSYIYVASRVSINTSRSYEEAARVTTVGNDFAYSKIHDATQPLTSFMDEEIGFPLDVRRPDYEIYIPRFFDKFIELADEEWSKLAINYKARWFTGGK